MGDFCELRDDLQNSLPPSICFHLLLMSDASTSRTDGAAPMRHGSPVWWVWEAERLNTSWAVAMRSLSDIAFGAWRVVVETNGRGFAVSRTLFTKLFTESFRFAGAIRE